MFCDRMNVHDHIYTTSFRAPLLYYSTYCNIKFLVGCNDILVHYFPLIGFLLIVDTGAITVE